MGRNHYADHVGEVFQGKMVPMTELEKELNFLKSPCGQRYPNMHTRIEINDRLANRDKIPHTFKGIMWEIIKEKEKCQTMDSTEIVVEQLPIMDSVCLRVGM